MLKRLKHFAKFIQENVSLYKQVIRDPDCPWLARILLGLAVVYLLLPLDLIPDWIPVIGWLDDLLLVPLFAWLGLKLIPEELLLRHKDNN